MSNLLVNEYPMILLPRLAVAIGLNEAIVLQQIQYWIHKYKIAEDSRHFQQGYWWVWNTYDQWQRNFPFWSKATIKRIIARLRKPLGANQNGKAQRGPLIICKPINARGYDRTLWYRIDYQELVLVEAQMLMPGPKEPEVQDAPVPSVQNATLHDSIPIPPIPETTQRLPKNTSAAALRPRIGSGKNAIRAALEEHFISKTKLPSPKTRTAKQQRASATAWWQPLREIAELVDWNERNGKALIDACLLRLKGFTVCEPRSILKTARGIMGERARGVARSRDGPGVAVGPGSRAGTMRE